ncbi:MAG: nucleotidyltransferase domain-containing protein [Candidatus Kuenenbacteria bacterium]
MSNIEIKKIVKKYAQALKEKKYSFFKIYLFGSCAKKNQNKWSDIDVAIITDKLKKNKDKNRFLLWDIRMDVDTRIEPHGFTVEDFQNEYDPMVYEIKNTGIEIKI